MTGPAGWTLAIDFGTSNTVVVVKDQHGVNIVEFAGQKWFPSVVFAKDDGSLVAGIEAFNSRLVEPRRYFTDVKQALTNNSPDIYLAGKAYPATEAVAAVLAEAKTAAMASRGDDDPPTRTALTHPVTWDDDQIGLLRTAADLAGLPDVTTYREPVAAAFHLYHNRFQPGDHIAVYDLGGGTFDIAILERQVPGESGPGQPVPPPFEVVDMGGDPDIGGEHFDDELWKLLGSGDLKEAPAWVALQDESRPDPKTDEQRYLNWLVGRRELKQSIIDAKIHLSKRDQAAVFVPAITFPQTINRADLEAALLTQLTTTVELLQKLIVRNHLSNADIVHVALVGGSSLIPLVKRLLAELAQFDDTRVSAQSSAQTVVAQGAAALAEVRRAETDAERAFNAAEACAADIWKEAAALYQQAIECRDKVWSPRAAYALGQLRERHPGRALFRKNYDAAVNAYKVAIDYQGSDWAALATLALAKLYLVTDRLAEAEVTLENAVHANHPEASPEAAYNLGLVHIRRDDWRSAEDAWQTAIDHRHPEWAPQAAYALGAQRKMRRNHLGARDAWRIAIDDFTHTELSPRVACELGGLLADKGRKAWRIRDDEYRQAIEAAYQTAIDSDHPYFAPRAAYELGTVRQKRKDWAGAAAAYQTAVNSGNSEWATKAIKRKAEIRRHI